MSLIVGGGVAANASSQPVSQAEPQTSSTLEQVASVENFGAQTTVDPEAVKLLEKTTIILLSATITEADGTKVFNFQQAVVAGATEQQAKDFSTGFTATGGTVINAPTGMVFAKPSAAKSLELKAAVQALAACAGRTQKWSDIWGSHYEVNSCTANKMIAILTVGGGSEALIGALAAAFAIPVAGWLAAAAAALMAIGGGALGYCAANGTGITVHFTGVPWCGAQKP